MRPRIQFKGISLEKILYSKLRFLSAEVPDGLDVLLIKTFFIMCSQPLFKG